MKRKGILRDVRGISMIVTALILIAIALVGGGVVYAVLRSQATTISTHADAQITSADIVVTPAMQVVTVSVKNIGTSKLVSCGVVVYDDDGSEINLAPENQIIDVAQTVSFGKSEAGLKFTAGKSYAGKFTGTTEDNSSTVTKTFSILAHG